MFLLFLLYKIKYILCTQLFLYFVKYRHNVCICLCVYECASNCSSVALRRLMCIIVLKGKKIDQYRPTYCAVVSFQKQTYLCDVLWAAFARLRLCVLFLTGKLAGFLLSVRDRVCVVFSYFTDHLCERDCVS